MTAALVELDACPSERGSTRFEGWVPDQAALQSFLSRLAELGIELISVRRIDATG